MCDGGGGSGGVCVSLCVHGVGILLQLPEMKLAFLLQFISR